jgi:hypothetical protein
LREIQRAFFDQVRKAELKRSDWILKVGSRHWSHGTSRDPCLLWIGPAFSVIDSYAWQRQ